MKKTRSKKSRDTVQLMYCWVRPANCVRCGWLLGIAGRIVGCDVANRWVKHGQVCVVRDILWVRQPAYSSFILKSRRDATEGTLPSEMRIAKSAPLFITINENFQTYVFIRIKSRIRTQLPGLKVPLCADPEYLYTHFWPECTGNLVLAHFFNSAITYSWILCTLNQNETL